MRLLYLAANNYKSLRKIQLTPGDLTVVVGANAAGKTNLVDCIDFLSEVYRHGLEVAVARKGGYENMAFRRMRRSKSAISFEILVEVSSADYRLPDVRRHKQSPLRFRHSFSLATEGAAIRAAFSVTSERLVVQVQRGDSWIDHTTVTRERSGDIVTVQAEEFAKPTLRLPGVDDRSRLDLMDFTWFDNQRRQLSSSELFTTSLGRYALGTRPLVNALSGMRVFQISPTKSREFGVPVPRPELAGSGAGLPAVVDHIKRTRSKDWKVILSAMRAILPNLHDISVDYTSSRTLGLLFKENGVGKAWNIGEVSDGTVQSLALLVAIFDHSFTILVIEEPENSVHPWIIRRLMDACSQASRARQIIITTHSPLVVNAVPPESIVVAWRTNGETHVQPLVNLDPEYLAAWQSGKVPTFEYLDSGAAPEALPPGPDGEYPSA